MLGRNVVPVSVVVLTLILLERTISNEDADMPKHACDMDTRQLDGICCFAHDIEYDSIIGVILSFQQVFKIENDNIATSKSFMWWGTGRGCIFNIPRGGPELA
jgi:hypothetical protein